jgi:hypothetical protein
MDLDYTSDSSGYPIQFSGSLDVDFAFSPLPTESLVMKIGSGVCHFVLLCYISMSYDKS